MASVVYLLGPPRGNCQVACIFWLATSCCSCSFQVFYLLEPEVAQVCLHVLLDHIVVRLPAFFRNLQGVIPVTINYQVLKVTMLEH